MNNETRKKAKEKACGQFLDEATIGDNSTFLPKENLTPYTLYNIDDSNRDKLVKAIQAIPQENLLLIVLGESQDLVDKILDKHHKALEQPFVKEFQGSISILAIDPQIHTPEGKDTIEYPIEKSLKDHGVVTFTGINAKFPLTPIYGPHKRRSISYLHTLGVNGLKTFSWKLHETVKKEVEEAFKEKPPLEPAFALRRLIHENALAVLNTLVKHEGPLFITSRITSLCYRSFKYLIDIRAQFGRKTLVRYGYTIPNEKRGGLQQCVSAEEFPLFPSPFTKCMSEKKNNKREIQDDILNTYYMNKNTKNFIKNETKRERLRKRIILVNEWANQELQKRTPAPEPKPKGGNRRNKTRKRKY